MLRFRKLLWEAEGVNLGVMAHLEQTIAGILVPDPDLQLNPVQKARRNNQPASKIARARDEEWAACFDLIDLIPVPCR